ncbi:MAG: hypothetical protein KKA45_04365 [Alphaproteobacteria bacterium]|nr:hypothetical protein [Alphaproteobacteria bacterium]
MTAPRKPADPIVSGGPSKPETPKSAAKKAAPKKAPAAPKAELVEAAAPATAAPAESEPVMTTMPPPPVLTPDQRAAALKAQRKRNIAIGLGLVGFIVIVYLVTVLRMGGAIASRPL